MMRLTRMRQVRYGLLPALLVAGAAVAFSGIVPADAAGSPGGPGGPATGPGNPAGGPGGPITGAASQGPVICGDGWEWSPSVEGVRYLIRNDDFGDGTSCIRVSQTRSAFRVISTQGRGNRFPYVGYGCGYDLCTPLSVLPRLWAWGGADIKVTFGTKRGASGSWDDALDTWLDPSSAHQGQAHAEVMIWIARHDNFGSDAGYRGIYRVDGQDWYLVEHTTCNAATGKCWPLVMFRAVHQTSYVRGLHLEPFYEIAYKHHWIGHAWWLLSVDGGFEIASGGQGLAVTWFTVSDP